MIPRPVNEYESYHAHVYFDEMTEAAASDLLVRAWQACHIGIGRFHRRPIGPHPRWSCQISFDSDEFDRLVPWLEANRGDLDILVHPLTGEALKEHSELATWLGQPVELNLEIFSASNSADSLEPRS